MKAMLLFTKTHTSMETQEKKETGKVVFKGIVKDNDGVITHIVCTSEILSKTINVATLKNVLITQIKSLKLFPELVTFNGTEVTIVKDKYFRTDGDKDATNDLLDLPEYNLKNK